MTFEQFSQANLPVFESYLKDQLQKLRSTLSQRFGLLVDAMAYSLDVGGKRLRPLLTLASSQCLGLHPRDVLPAALALEFIHTYSLVHDDLPAMDDDDERRGKPSSHIRYGEAVAILTGDALLTEAFGQMKMLADHGKFKAEQVLSAIELLVAQSGARGMVGGQLLDVTLATDHYNLPEVEFVHIHKTGALILASVLMPAKLTQAENETILPLKRYGEAIGLAFQVSDDLLDSDTSRYSRGPRKKPKPAYTHLMSRSETRERLNALVETAKQAVLPLGKRAEALVGIAEFIGTREK